MFPFKMCTPGDLATLVKTGLCVAGRTNREAAHFELVYITSLRTEIFGLGDPANCIKTSLRFARRANQADGRFQIIYATCLHLEFVLQVILELWPARVCALGAERIRNQDASNL